MNTTNLDALCMACFSPLQPGVSICPACGCNNGEQTSSGSGYTPPPHHLPLRTILGGKYLVGKALGEGGFGITYIGYDLNLDIRVAIKEYYPSGFATRTATVSETVTPVAGDSDNMFTAGRDRFVDEAKRLAHFRVLPGIVMVNDFFVENSTAYIVMEFVEGMTLKQYLTQSGGKLPAEQVLDMLLPLFGSLAQVHSGGIIHRDISPDNIMVTPNGNVKLLDFGAAREFDDNGNKSLSVLLKHGYAPSEQYTSKGVQGPFTDVYALSATIYKAITGVTPDDAMARIIKDDTAPPSKLGIAIAPHQEAALMRGMAVRQEDRFQSIPELYAALYGTQASAVRSETPQSTVTRLDAGSETPHLVTVQPIAGNAAFDKPKRHTNWKVAAIAVVAVAVAALIIVTGGDSGDKAIGTVTPTPETSTVQNQAVLPTPMPTPTSTPTPMPTPTPTPTPNPLDNLLGVWDGTRTTRANLGPAGWRLIVFMDGTNYRAVVYTYPVPEGPQDESLNGSFLANVSYNKTNDTYEIKGYEYIEQDTFFNPDFALWVGRLEGDYFWGGINDLEGNTRFWINRIDRNSFNYQGPHNHITGNGSIYCIFCNEPAE